MWDSDCCCDPCYQPHSFVLDFLSNFAPLCSDKNVYHKNSLFLGVVSCYLAVVYKAATKVVILSASELKYGIFIFRRRHNLLCMGLKWAASVQGQLTVWYTRGKKGMVGKKTNILNVEFGSVRCSSSFQLGSTTNLLLSTHAAFHYSELHSRKSECSNPAQRYSSDAN